MKLPDLLVYPRLAPEVLVIIFPGFLRRRFLVHRRQNLISAESGSRRHTSIQSMRPITVLLSLIMSASMPGDSPDRDALVRDAVENYFRSARLMREFAVVRQTERIGYHGDGRQKERDNWTQRIDFIDGVRVGWTIERDGRPLSEDDLARGHASARQAAVAWKAKSLEERGKAIVKADKETEYLREFPHALTFTALPGEQVDGREAMVWSFKPRPGYKAKTMGGRVYEGVTGKIWLDKAERQLARIVAVVTHDVSIGGFLAKIEKGTRFELTQTRIEPGCWLPSHQFIRYSAQILFVKGIRRSVDTHYRHWQRTSAPIWTGG